MNAGQPPDVRQPGSLPDPGRPAGTANPDWPFDHVVVVVMENHSLDNLLGALKTKGPFDGLNIDANGKTAHSNPDAKGEPVYAFPLKDTSQAQHVGQSWQATHEQINNGEMDGFVRSSKGYSEPMGYYTKEVLPFAYSLAETFTVADRWFCSMPGPTYPNRRFLLAGTAFGGTETAFETLLDDPPPRGTIFDQLSAHDISWADYFTDVPMTSVIPSIIKNHLDHHHPLHHFFEACRTGDLPAVSFVDPGAGVVSSMWSHLGSLPIEIKAALKFIGVDVGSPSPAETEEDPQDMYYGEDWAHSVVEAVLHSPAWPRTLLIYTYDEHGGYFDHVKPPAAIAPDDIAPKLKPGDPPGDYTMYGPRVPAIVVSPYSRPGGVTSVEHDHCSILATIEAKWNLPALTLRDANAAPVTDFLDFTNQSYPEPPPIVGPSRTGPSGPVVKAQAADGGSTPPSAGAATSSTGDDAEMSTAKSQSGTSNGANSSAGSPSDALSTLASAIVQAAETQPTSTADPHMSRAFALGWHMEELNALHQRVQKAEHKDLPGLGSLNDQQQEAVVVDQIKADVVQLSDLVKQAGIDTGLTVPAIKDLGSAPASEDSVLLTHLQIIGALNATDFRLGKAYGLGRALADTCREPTDMEGLRKQLAPIRVANLLRWLDDLASVLPDHAANSVSKSLASWRDAAYPKKVPPAPTLKPRQRLVARWHGDRRPRKTETPSFVAPNSDKAKTAPAKAKAAPAEAKSAPVEVKPASAGGAKAAVAGGAKAAAAAEVKPPVEVKAAAAGGTKAASADKGDGWKALRRQGEVWRALLSGEKQGKDMLEIDNYLDAVRDFTSRVAAITRGLITRMPFLSCVVAVLIAGGITLLALGGGSKIAAGATSVLVAFGLTWKGFGTTAGKLIGKLEQPLWGAVLDDAIADAITLLPSNQADGFGRRRVAMDMPLKQTTKPPEGGPPPDTTQSSAQTGRRETSRPSGSLRNTAADLGDQSQSGRR